MIANRQQQGVVLFLSLVMLLLLTILGVSSIQTTSLQQRMARNADDTNLAFQAAESALRDGEDLLEAVTSLIDFDGGSALAQDNGYYFAADPGAVPNWIVLNCPVPPCPRSWAAPVGARTADTVITGVAAQPKYIMEYLTAVISDADALNLDNIGQDTGSGTTQIFRVTALGTGGTLGARVMIQATYGKRL